MDHAATIAAVAVAAAAHHHVAVQEDDAAPGTSDRSTSLQLSAGSTESATSPPKRNHSSISTEEGEDTPADSVATTSEPQAHQAHPDHRDEEQYSEAGPSSTSARRQADESCSGMSPNNQKKRRINTCLQCKSRKVKCNKERPLCGPCRKHGVKGACTWVAIGEPVWSESIGVNESPVETSPVPLQGPSWQTPSSSSSRSQTNPSHGNHHQADELRHQIATLQARLRLVEGGSAEEPPESYPSAPVGGNLTNEAATHPDSTLTGRSERSTSSSRHHHTGSWTCQDATSRRIVRRDDIDILPPSQHHSNGNQAPRFPALLNRASTSPNPCLPFFFSTKDNPNAVREAISLLPSDEIVDYIIGSNSAAWTLTGCGYVASLRLVTLQLVPFRERRDLGDYGTIDLSFLALLFHLLVLYIDFEDPCNLIANDIVDREDSIPALVELWQSTGEAMLSLADCLGSPNLNSLMALVVSRHVYTNQGRLFHAASLLVVAIRIAQSLGLHRLGSARDDEARWRACPTRRQNLHDFGPTILSSSSSTSNTGVNTNTNTNTNANTNGQDGFAFSAMQERIVQNGLSIAPEIGIGCGFNLPEQSHFLRETGRKLWYHLLFHDWMNSPTSRFYHLSRGQWTTMLPLNVDEEDLPDGTGPDPYTLPEEKPPGVPSCAFAFPYLLQMTDVCAQLCDAYSGGREPSYDEILALDGKWRRTLQDLPVFLRLDGHSENLDFVRAEERRSPHLSTMRIVLLEGVNHRLVLLHRHLLIRGHSDPRFSPSIRAAVEAARMVIFCRRTLVESGDTLQKYWFFRSHVFTAAMLLCVHLLELAKKQKKQKKDPPQGETEEMTRLRGEIACATAMLDEGKRTNGFTVVHGNMYRTAKSIIARLMRQVDRTVASPDGSAATVVIVGKQPSRSVHSLYTNTSTISDPDPDQAAGPPGTAIASDTTGDPSSGTAPNLSIGSSSLASAGDALSEDLEKLLDSLLGSCRGKGEESPSPSSSSLSFQSQMREEVQDPITATSIDSQRRKEVPPPPSSSGVVVVEEEEKSVPPPPPPPPPSSCWMEDELWSMIDSLARPSFVS